MKYRKQQRRIAARIIADHNRALVDPAREQAVAGLLNALKRIEQGVMFPHDTASNALAAYEPGDR